MNALELLAPAKDLACGVDAVNCGADAVYIGAERFGARISAGNSLHDIEKLAAHAHRYRAKVYVALNTILSDEELPRVRRLARSLWEAGADALIVQDMGLLEGGLPPIPLIASTQTHNTTPEKVLFLEKAGFKRVILGRELTLAEIKAIRAVTTVELEAFVHGALCVCYSGQCYLSYFLGGRSGNRGECAQPCRKLYTLKDAAGGVLSADKHLLSLKDLNLSRRLSHLAAAGVTSFKIEGRLKDRDYVRNIVAHYRRELDKVLAKRGEARPSIGKSILAFEPNPAKTFNRGYTEYFIDGNPADIASPDTPKFVGEALGPATDIKNGSFRLHNAALLHPGDGISYFDKRGVLAGSLVNGVVDGRVRADNLKGMENGTSVYRNLDKEFMRTLERGAQRRFALKLQFADVDGGFLLKASDERGAAAEVKWRGVKAEAQKPEAALDTIRKQLSKLGETQYWLEALELKLSKPYFLPVAALNDLRRDVLAALEKADLPPQEREQRKITPNDYPYPQEKLDHTGNVMNASAAAFYKRHGVKEVGMAAENGADLSGKALMTTKYCLRRRLGLCKKGKAVEALFLEDGEGRRFRLEFDCAACVMKLYFDSETAPAKEDGESEE